MKNKAKILLVCISNIAKEMFLFVCCTRDRTQDDSTPELHPMPFLVLILRQDLVMLALNMQTSFFKKNF